MLSIITLCHLFLELFLLLSCGLVQLLIRLDVVQCDSSRPVELLANFWIGLSVPLFIVNLNRSLHDRDDIGKINACHISFVVELNTTKLIPYFEVLNGLEISEGHSMKDMDLREHRVAFFRWLRQLISRSPGTLAFLFKGG